MENNNLPKRLVSSSAILALVTPASPPRLMASWQATRMFMSGLSQSGDSLGSGLTSTLTLGASDGAVNVVSVLKYFSILQNQQEF